jgi:ribosomal protein S18 acetylase RimI-like enzyme
MDNLIIRKAAVKDATSIFELNRDELGYTYDVQKTLKRLQYLLSQPEHYLLIAESNSEVVGYIHANNYDLAYSDSLKNIMGIAVKKTFQRNGIGKKLLLAVEDWAKKEGAIGVRLVSGSTRKQAHIFYTSCGYMNNKLQYNFSKLFDMEAEV